MSENMTICPDCGSKMAPTVEEESESGVHRALHQSCTDCDHEVDIAILEYPNHEYVVIAPAIDGDTCRECDSDSIVRFQRIGKAVVTVCSDHLRLHHKSAFEKRNDLL